MKLYDFGTSALVLAFLGGFFLSLGAVTFGEPVESDSTPRGVIFSTND